MHESLRHHICNKRDVVRPKMSRKQNRTLLSFFKNTKHVGFCNHEVHLR